MDDIVQGDTVKVKPSCLIFSLEQKLDFQVSVRFRRIVSNKYAKGEKKRIFGG